MESFINIPSFLTEGVQVEKDNVIITPFGTCTPSCENGCQGACQSSYCETYCQSPCEGKCQNCQTGCQIRCENTCEKSCQYACENYCMTNCEGCEIGCQNCQNSACERYCQSCEGCESSCESSCQNCQGEQSSENIAKNATLSITDIGVTYCTATVSGLNHNGAVIRIEFYANGVLKNTSMTSSSSSISSNITGLIAGTTYDIQAKIYNNSSGALLKTLSKNATTQAPPDPPKLPTPTLNTLETVKTANSIKVTINGNSNADYYYFRINGGSAINNGINRTYTFTNLLSNTQYLIEIKIGGAGYRDSDWASYYATTLIGIEAWEWHNPKTTDGGFNITRAEWIAFCNKINEVRVSKGLSSYSFTTSTTYIDKDKPFYAWIFLQAANAVNEINGQVSQQCLSVKAGNNIYAWYFENLKSALNNAIL